MFGDSAGAADQCQTTAALIISTLAAIISAFSLSVSAVNMASETEVPIYFGVIIFIVFIGIASIYPIIRIHRRLRIADNYRNACLALIALSDNDKDGETEGK